MTDLFSRIAERALGLAPLIQPMITPFYALVPQRDGDELLLDMSLDKEQSDVSSDIPAARATTGKANKEPEVQPVASASSPASKREPAARQAERTHVEENIVVAPYPELRRTLPRASIPDQTVALQPVYDRHIQETQTAATTGGNTRRELLPVERPANKQGERRLTVTPSEEWQFTIPPPVRVQSVHPLPAATPSISFAEQKALLPRKTEVAEDTRRVPPQEHMPGGNAVFHTASWAERRSDERGRGPEVGRPAPTIQVTIGRIDVRATSALTTQAQQQRQPAAPKTMSLDEYLKQSGKGGR